MSHTYYCYQNLSACSKGPQWLTLTRQRDFLPSPDIKNVLSSLTLQSLCKTTADMHVVVSAHLSASLWASLSSQQMTSLL